MIAVAIVVSTLGISLGIRRKLGGELKAYGANIVITPREGYLSEGTTARNKKAGSGLWRLLRETGVEDYSGQLYAVVTVNNVDVEMIGMDFKRVKHWKIAGRWPSEGEILAGTNIRDALGLKAGDTVTVGFGGRYKTMKVAGFIERGGPEDSAVMLDLTCSQRLTGLEGKLSAVLARAGAKNLKDTVRILENRLPEVNVKTLRQVAYAEESFLKKIELLMVLVTLVVLVTSNISVSSTMSATVLERMKEIGLMRAIGGTKNDIRSFYLAEGTVIGFLGGLSGYVLGVVSAQVVSKGAFNSYIQIPFYVFLVSLAMGLLIAVSSGMLPLTGALRYKPSSILRGE